MFLQRVRKIFSEDLPDSFADECLAYLYRAFLFPLKNKFDFSRHARKNVREVTNARDDAWVVRNDGAALCIAHEIFHRSNRQSGTNAGFLIDELVSPRLKGYLLNNFSEIMWDVDIPSIATDHRFLFRDANSVFKGARIVGKNLGVNSVFQRCNNIAAVRVVLGICREHDHKVERYPDVETTDLNIFFLHDIKEADLDSGLKVRKFVDSEDSSIRAGNDPEVNRPLVRVVEPLRRGLNRVDVADEVGNRDVRGREFFPVSGIAVEPLDLDVVPVLLDEIHAALAHWLEGVVIDFASLDDGNELVEKIHETPNDSRLRLAAEAKENHVVPCEQCVYDGGRYGFLVADDCGEEFLVIVQLSDEVVTNLILNREDFVLAPSKFSSRFCTFHASLLSSKKRTHDHLFEYKLSASKKQMHPSLALGRIGLQVFTKSGKLGRCNGERNK